MVIIGGMGDCTTLRDGELEFESEFGFGGRGRKRRIGRLRKGWEGGGRRMFIMRWKEGRLTI